MSELLHQLGINWKLLAAQATNFFLLLVILRLTVYKPLLKLLGDRRKKIEQGLLDAETAARDLSEAEEIKASKIAEGERESVALIVSAEKRAKETETSLVAAAKEREVDIISKAKMRGETEIEAERERFHREAAGLMRAAMEKAVAANPDAISDALVEEAVAKLGKTQ